MTTAGPLTVFGIRYCTYIWLTVIVPGCERPPTAVPGCVDWASWPLTKKLPSSCSSNGPPSDPAIALPPVASSTAAAAARQFPPMQIMDKPPVRGRKIDVRSLSPVILQRVWLEAYCARADRQGNRVYKTRSAVGPPIPPAQGP